MTEDERTRAERARRKAQPAARREERSWDGFVRRVRRWLFRDSGGTVADPHKRKK